MKRRTLTGTQVLELNDHWAEVVALAKEMWTGRPGEPDQATLRSAGLAFLERRLGHGRATGAPSLVRATAPASAQPLRPHRSPGVIRRT